MIHVHAVNNIPEFCKVLKDLKWRVVGTGSKSMNGHLSEIPCTPVDSFHFKDSTLIILGKRLGCSNAQNRSEMIRYVSCMTAIR